MATSGAFDRKRLKQALNTALRHATIPDQITVYLPLHYPFFKPDKTIFISYNFIIPLKNKAALGHLNRCLPFCIPHRITLKFPQPQQDFFCHITEIKKGFNLLP